MSKTLVFIITVALLGLLVFGGLLYYTLRTKVTDISNKRPYIDFVGKKVRSKRNAVLVLSRKADAYACPYLLTEKEDALMSDAAPTYPLPSGTELQIQSAKVFKNGTSGFEHAFVLGAVFVEELNEEVSFEYRWGEAHTSIYNEYQDYWTFSLALWQEGEELTEEKFYLK